MQEEEPELYRTFCNKYWVRRTSKDSCKLKKIRYLNQWIYYFTYGKIQASGLFDMHLNYLGPIYCFSPSWIPSGCILGGYCNGWGLVNRQHLSLSWDPSNPVVQCGCSVSMAAASFLDWYGQQHFFFHSWSLEECVHHMTLWSRFS